MYEYLTSGELDHRTFTTPSNGASVTSGGFSSAFDTSETTAMAIFGGFTPASPQPIRLMVVLWRDGIDGIYNFPNNDNGAILTLSSGTHLGTITYVDHADNQLVDVGDELHLSGLLQGEDYIIILVWDPTGDSLDFEVFSTPESVVPTGTWGAKMPISNTAYDVDFGKISPEPQPMDLKIILVRNLTVEGTYSFTSNFDGPLSLTGGTNVGTLTYADLADNEKVNIGDRLRLRNLAPNSDYTLKMIWGPTGDQITSTTFTTAA